LSKPLNVTAVLATEPMLVSVGLVCSIGEVISLLSKDGLTLVSKDGFVLFGKQ
jgi:hypothetical protein